MSVPLIPPFQVRLLRARSCGRFGKRRLVRGRFPNGPRPQLFKHSGASHDRQQRTASRRTHPEGNHRKGARPRGNQKQHGSAHPAAPHRTRRLLYRARRALLHALHERLHASLRSAEVHGRCRLLARPLPRARRRCRALHGQYHARGCGRRRPHQLGRGGHELGARLARQLRRGPRSSRSSTSRTWPTRVPWPKA